MEEKTTDELAFLQARFEKMARGALIHRGFKIVDEGEVLKSTTPFSFVVKDKKSKLLSFVFVFGKTPDGVLTKQRAAREEYEMSSAKWLVDHQNEDAMYDNCVLNFDEMEFHFVGENSIVAHHVTI